MKKGKNQHIVKHPDGWTVKGAGNSKATKVTKTQKESIEIAEDIARNQQSDTKAHGRDGKILQVTVMGMTPNFRMVFTLTPNLDVHVIC